MNDIIKDILSENFTRRQYVVYGIVAPLVLVLVCGLAGSLARRKKGGWLKGSNENDSVALRAEATMAKCNVGARKGNMRFESSTSH
jgi:hypothetical protein